MRIMCAFSDLLAVRNSDSAAGIQFTSGVIICPMRSFEMTDVRYDCHRAVRYIIS